MIFSATVKTNLQGILSRVYDRNIFQKEYLTNWTLYVYSNLLMKKQNCDYLPSDYPCKQNVSSEVHIPYAKDYNLFLLCYKLRWHIEYNVQIHQKEIYFKISLGWDKNKWGKWSLLLIFRVHLLKYDTRALSSTASAILPPSFLVWLQYGAVRCYFPHLFLSLASEILKYSIGFPLLYD